MARFASAARSIGCEDCASITSRIPIPDKGENCEGFQAVLRSVEKGRTWVKLSAGYRLTWQNGVRRATRARMSSRGVSRASCSITRGQSGSCGAAIARSSATRLPSPIATPSTISPAGCRTRRRAGKMSETALEALFRLDRNGIARAQSPLAPAVRESGGANLRRYRHWGPLAAADQRIPAGDRRSIAAHLRARVEGRTARRVIIPPRFSALSGRPPNDHRLPRALHDRAGRPAEVSRRADRRPQGPGVRAAEGEPQRSATTRFARASRARSSSSSASAAPTSRSSRRAPRRWRITSATRRPASTGRRHCNDLIQRVVRPVSGQLRRRVPAAAVAGRAAGQLHRRARALRRRSWGSSAAT